jgi:hypothetical protein
MDVQRLEQLESRQALQALQGHYLRRLLLCYRPEPQMESLSMVHSLIHHARVQAVYHHGTRGLHVLAEAEGALRAFQSVGFA